MRSDMEQLTLEKTDEIIDRYGARISSLLAMMQDVQAEVNYVPRFAIERIAKKVDVSEAHIFRLATFYHALSMKPRGEHVCQVCMGTACHVRGAPLILSEVSRQLGIKPGETTPDGKFTIETVNCVGSCALAPVVVSDKVYYGNLTSSKVDKILKEIGRRKKTRN